MVLRRHVKEGMFDEYEEWVRGIATFAHTVSRRALVNCTVQLSPYRYPWLMPL